MLITIVAVALATPLTVWSCHGTRGSKIPLGECWALERLEWTEEEHSDPTPSP